jgi:aconitate hydratase
MVFDLELIKKIYSELPAKVAAARKLVGKPLTLTEKILYAHLSGLYLLRPITEVRIT